MEKYSKVHGKMEKNTGMDSYKSTGKLSKGFGIMGNFSIQINDNMF